jgi:hypothetical protein
MALVHTKSFGVLRGSYDGIPDIISNKICTKKRDLTYTKMEIVPLTYKLICLLREAHAWGLLITPHGDGERITT